MENLQNSMILIERLRHFEEQQKAQGDGYGAEVLHRAAERLERMERALSNIALAGMDVPAAEGEDTFFYKHELGRCIGLAAQALIQGEALKEALADE